MPRDRFGLLVDRCGVEPHQPLVPVAELADGDADEDREAGLTPGTRRGRRGDETVDPANSLVHYRSMGCPYRYAIALVVPLLGSGCTDPIELENDPDPEDLTGSSAGSATPTTNTTPNPVPPTTTDDSGPHTVEGSEPEDLPDCLGVGLGTTPTGQPCTANEDW